MVSSRALQHMLKSPRRLMEFQATGRVPAVIRPSGPLYVLLSQLNRGDLSRCTGVLIDHRLGYTGSRRFQYGSQALRWVAPEGEQFQAWPAESWRDKRFAKQLYLEDFLACCASSPSDMLERYPHLRKPVEPDKPSFS